MSERWMWRVACINWSYPTAPKAIVVGISDKRIGAHIKYFPTWREAIAYADKRARQTTTNGDKK